MERLILPKLTNTIKELRSQDLNSEYIATVQSGFQNGSWARCAIHSQSSQVRPNLPVFEWTQSSLNIRNLKKERVAPGLNVGDFPNVIGAK